MSHSQECSLQVHHNELANNQWISPSIMNTKWSNWHPLEGASRNQAIPNTSGLYRVRRPEHLSLEYLGQTGGSLRSRLGHLHGVFGDEIPYADPHTAAPGLWALRQDLNCDYEVSVAEVSGDTSYRKGRECLEISHHRIEHHRSPTMNFGRMPEGWIKSSGNNRRLVITGKRFRGYRNAGEGRIPDAPPPLDLHSDPMSDNWMGLPWQEFCVSQTQVKMVGLYRALHQTNNSLIYVGQSSASIAGRVLAHMAKSTKPNHRQHSFFDKSVIWQWANMYELNRTQLLEIENDLIASHMLAHDRPPNAQFLG